MLYQLSYGGPDLKIATEQAGRPKFRRKFRAYRSYSNITRVAGEHALDGWPNH